MDYTEIIKQIRRSIALVLILDANNQIVGTGSGFIYSKKGILVTCNHVIKDAVSVLLKFNDSLQYVNAKVIIQDEEHDLALLKFEDDSREPLEKGNPEKTQEGAAVVFSGYPLSSLDLTTHQGIVSAIIKDATGIVSFLIDGTVNSGNSGCPLMDSDGNVIGVVDAKRRVRNDLLEKVESMTLGAMSLHGVDVVEIYQTLANNVQIGVGHAVPAYYIPEHKEKKDIEEKIKKGGKEK